MAMKNTNSPEQIYEVFERYGFHVVRIDQFDRGNYAEIRAQLNYPKFLSTMQLQEITMKLSLLEKNEDLRLEIANIDMIHRTMRINLHTKD
jgi:hypothetical protein